jgi:hypothetical protein
MKEIVFGQDGDFREDRFRDTVNAHLANDIGNLTNRCLGLLKKNCASSYPVSAAAVSAEHPLRAAAAAAAKRAAAHYDAFAMHEAIDCALDITGRCGAMHDAALAMHDAALAMHYACAPDITGQWAGALARVSCLQCTAYGALPTVPCPGASQHLHSALVLCPSVLVLGALAGCCWTHALSQADARSYCSNASSLLCVQRWGANMMVPCMTGHQHVRHARANDASQNAWVKPSQGCAADCCAPARYSAHSVLCCKLLPTACAMHAVPTACWSRQPPGPPSRRVLRRSSRMPR